MLIDLSALPVGTYDLTAELSGFNKIENKGVVVNVGQSLTIGLTLTVASVQENVTVTGETPLIETRSVGIGGLIVVAVAVLLSITLLPALLAVLLVGGLA